ncbi:MAG: hypothetical protein JWO11_2298 [Nocardioides sp.]|nr:hypothetical protein [Nocardioides sp.]
MNGYGSITVSVRGVLLTGLVLLALAVAYLVGGSGEGGNAAQAAPAAGADAGAAATARSLTMEGVVEATAVPDQLTFGLSVGVTRADLNTALADANRTMRRVLSSLREYGVKRRDVQTTGLSMNPVYDYPAYSPPVLRGYRVSESASVLVKELKQGGGAVSAAVAAGRNAVRVSNIRLKVGDPEAVLAKARKAAVAQATAKAQEYADATGQALGGVLTLRELRATTPSDRELGGYADTAELGSMDAANVLPIRTGREDLRVTVQVVWEFA